MTQPQWMTGALGFRFQPDADWEAVGESPRSRVFATATGQRWAIANGPFPFDLRPEFDEQLRLDVERSARWEFERTHAELQAEGRIEDPPRTEDPSWSPVVSMATTPRGDSQVLTVVRRQTYARGHELVVAELIAPIASGSVQVESSALATTTGLRESMVMAMRRSSEAMSHPGQAALDDESLDASMPDYPLSLARAAIRRLSSDETLFMLTEPPPAPARGEVELPGAGCALVPPPRFLPVAPDALPLGNGMSMLVRAGLGRWMLLLDVYRVPEAIIPRARALTKHSATSRQSWSWAGPTRGPARCTRIPDPSRTSTGVRRS